MKKKFLFLMLVALSLPSCSSGGDSKKQPDRNISINGTFTDYADKQMTKVSNNDAYTTNENISLDDVFMLTSTDSETKTTYVWGFDDIVDQPNGAFTSTDDDKIKCIIPNSYTILIDNFGEDGSADIHITIFTPDKEEYVPGTTTDVPLESETPELPKMPYEEEWTIYGWTPNIAHGDPEVKQPGAEEKANENADKKDTTGRTTAHYRSKIIYYSMWCSERYLADNNVFGDPESQKQSVYESMMLSCFGIGRFTPLENFEQEYDDDSDSYRYEGYELYYFDFTGIATIGKYTVLYKYEYEKYEAIGTEHTNYEYIVFDEFNYVVQKYHEYEYISYFDGQPDYKYKGAWIETITYK